MDSDYKKHANAVLSKAANELRDVFGYQLVTGSQLVGTSTGKKDEYFLLSTSGSKRLRTLLAQSDKSAAYFGFMTLVLFSVLMSPGEKVSCASILDNVRKVDPRFPLHIVAAKNATVALAVPELGDDFLGLLNRMKKVSHCFVFHRSRCASIVILGRSPSRDLTHLLAFLAASAVFSNFCTLPDVDGIQEQYLGSAKDDVDTADLSKVVYSFGPRFFAEVG